jgi:hypothetical protein
MYVMSVARKNTTFLPSLFKVLTSALSYSYDLSYFSISHITITCIVFKGSYSFIIFFVVFINIQTF